MSDGFVFDDLIQSDRIIKGHAFSYYNEYMIMKQFWSSSLCWRKSLYIYMV